MEEHGHGDGHEHHGSPVKKYIAVFAMLTMLTGASFFTYSDLWPFKDTPSVGWLFMMAVSCCKASLVMLFFMHLKYEASWKYVLTVPAGIMSLFLMLALVPDVKWRNEEIIGGRKASEERREHMARYRLEHIAMPSTKKAHGANE